MRLRQAEQQDIFILSAFLEGLFALERDFTPNHEKQTQGLALLIDNPEHAAVFVVTLPEVPCEKIIGMIALHKSISTAEGGWVGRIEDLYLSPEYRGCGVGTKVIEEVIKIAQADGLRRITLNADKDNTYALNFYKRCGFEEMNLTSFIKKP